MGRTPATAAGSDLGSPAHGDASDIWPHAAEGEAAEPRSNKSRRVPAPINMEDSEATFWAAPSSLTGEMWHVVIHRYGADWATDVVEFECDRSYITFGNILSLKSKMGYTARDYLYYMKRSDNNSATLILVDYEHQIEPMLAACVGERKLRLVLSIEKPTQLHKSITPLKRPRAKTRETHEDVPTGEETIDAYKEWLENLEQDKPDKEFRDDYRDETVKTYKEWLRRKGFLTQILAYVDDDDSDGHIDSDDERQDRPSHARHNKKKGKGGSSESSKNNGRGALKGFASALKRIRAGSQKLKIEFASKLGGPTGPNTRSFVDEVVLFMRKRAPLIGVKKWSDIGQNVKNSIASDIMNRWDLQNIVDPKQKIWAVAKERYKGWRGTYSATYKAYNSYAQRIKNVPEDLDLVEWHYLIMYFGTDGFQKLSVSNSGNRGERRINHCAGSQPFSKISYEQRDPESGEEPTDIVLFMSTHSRNGQWSNEAAKAVYDDAMFKVQEKCIEVDTFISDIEENNIFQSTYKQSTGCKTSTTYGHGYMCTRPVQKESLQVQLERQASATLTANKKNNELQSEIEKLNEKLANQEAESERKLEEKMQQFKEEESKKFQALRDELMAAVQGGRQTPSAQPVESSQKHPTNQEEVTLPVHYTSANSPSPNANQTIAVQTVPKIPNIIPEEDTPALDKSAAISPASDPTETQVMKTTRKRLNPNESMPTRAKKNSNLAGVLQNKSYTTRQQLLNAAVRRVSTRRQQ